MFIFEHCKTLFKRLLCKFVVFVNKDTHCFVLEDKHLKIVPESALSADLQTVHPLFCITGPECSRESDHILPCETHAEATKLAKHFVVDAPQGALVRKHIVRSNDKWVLQVIVTSLPQSGLFAKCRPWFVIPLQWLTNITEEYQVFSALGGELHICHKQAVISHHWQVSGSSSKQALAAKNAPTLAVWQWEKGITEPAVSRHDNDQFIALLGRNLSQLSLQQWHNAYLASPSSESLSWALLCKVSAASAVIYFALTSLYIVSYDYYLAWQAARIQGDLNQALTHRASYLEAQQRFDERAALLRDDTPTIMAWSGVLRILQMDGVAISRLNIVDGKVEVFGSALRASDILVELNQTPGVENAEFTMPIRNLRGADSFAIAWQIRNLQPADIAMDGTQ